MPQPVQHVSDVQSFPLGPPQGSEAFGGSLAPIGPALGLTQLGCSVTTVPPGKRAFPFHNHLGNDELYVILAGEGTYRFGAQEHAVRAGSVCAAPRGGPDTAHQLINTGSSDLTYVAISTLKDPEVVEYPDSKKFAALAIAPGANFMDAHLKFVGRQEDSLDYWEGEA